MKKQTKESKKLRDKEYKVEYDGENSPYQEYMKGAPHRSGNSIGEYNEPPEANPDVLSEEDGLYYYKSTIDEELLDKVETTFSKLTDKQRLALQLVGYEGKTYENAGAIMGISGAAVFALVKRASEIIKSLTVNKKRVSRQ